MNKRKTVDEIRVALATDLETGLEGLCAHQVNGQWFPLIAADKDRFTQIEILADIIHAHTGQEIRLVKFTHREDIKVLPKRKRQ